MEELKLKYMERLSDLYPSIAKASTEIINLQAILNLPKLRSISDGYPRGVRRRLPMSSKTVPAPSAARSMMCLGTL